MGQFRHTVFLSLSTTIYKIPYKILDLYFYSEYLQLAEVICPDPPQIHNSDRVIEGTKLDDTTTYNCASGMRTDDGFTTKTIVCVVDELWSETHITCGRKCGFRGRGRVMVGVLGRISRNGWKMHKKSWTQLQFVDVCADEIQLRYQSIDLDTCQAINRGFKTGFILDESYYN